MPSEIIALPPKCFAKVSAKALERFKQLALVLGTIEGLLGTCWRGLCEGRRCGGCGGGGAVKAPLGSQRLGDYLRGTELKVADLTRHLNIRFEQDLLFWWLLDLCALPPCL